MEETKSILPILGIAGFSLYWSLMLFAYVKFKRNLNRIPQMSVDELQHLAKKGPAIYCNVVIEELQSRNEDFNFALPLLLELATGRKRVTRILGWMILRTHFAETLPDLDLTRDRPTEENLNLMNAILSTMRKESPDGDDFG